MKEKTIDIGNDRVVIVHNDKRIESVSIWGEGFYGKTLTRGQDFACDESDEEEVDLAELGQQHAEEREGHDDR